MVLLIQKLTKFYSKLDHHHPHPQPEALTASLQSFRSDVSSLVSNSKLEGLEIMSLEWFQECFQVLPLLNKAFAKLVVEIDYRMIEWKSKSMEEYLQYSLELLDHLNFISSSLSDLAQVRLCLSHALSFVESSPSSAIDRLQAIQFTKIGDHKEFKEKEKKENDGEMVSSEKEGIVLQALMELRSVVLWLCSILLAGLTGNTKIYSEMRRSAHGGLSDPSLINLDSSVSEIVMNKGCVLKEVKELKDSSAALANSLADGGNSSSDVAEEMQRKLEVFEKLLDGLGKEVNSLFSEVLSGRNQLLSGIRFRKQ